MHPLSWQTLLKKVLSSLQQKQITRFDITLFLRQLATLIAAGISITECCSLLEKVQEKTALRLLIYAIKREIMSGKSLFDSLKCHKQYFDEFTCQLIRIGELSGKLDTTLMHIAAHQENNLKIKKQIQQALVYPGVITTIACLVTYAMFVFVIPRFNELFHNMQGSLPFFTRCIFYLSRQLQAYCNLMALIIAALIILFYHKRKIILRYYSCKFALKTPVLKHCLHKIGLANFARNLALTLTAGIPLTGALQIAAQAENESEFTHDIAKLLHKVSTGLQLHQAMAYFPSFPPLMIQMIKIGEEAGKLPQMLTKTAEFLQSDIDNLISHFSKLLEPLIMVVLGVLIGGLVIGMYLPLFKLGSAF